jgi:hypothetical protein
MKNLWLREVATNEMLHSGPWPSRSPRLTAATQLMEPKLRDHGDELIQPSVVIRDGMVAKPPTNHTRKPTDWKSDGDKQNAFSVFAFDPKQIAEKRTFNQAEGASAVSLRRAAKTARKTHPNGCGICFETSEPF